MLCIGNGGKDNFKFYAWKQVELAGIPCLGPELMGLLWVCWNHGLVPEALDAFGVTTILEYEVWTQDCLTVQLCVRGCVRVRACACARVFWCCCDCGRRREVKCRRARQAFMTLHERVVSCRHGGCGPWCDHGKCPVPKRRFSPSCPQRCVPRCASLDRSKF